jgi:hypothetical protein
VAVVVGLAVLRDWLTLQNYHGKDRRPGPDGSDFGWSADSDDGGDGGD